MKKTVFTIILLVIIGVAFNAQAAVEVTATWSANSESDLAGYNIYRSSTSGSGYVKLNSSIIAKTSSPQYVDSISGSVETTYYYVVTAVDTSGNESAYSSEGSTHIDTSAPNPPSGITVQIQ
jgi:fibronectin type 3 domain-containing protein